MLQVADRWFETRKIDDSLTLLWEPHVHPLLRCNIWHVRGRDRDLLVDTGLGVASLKEAIEPQLDKPLTTVATHIHYDHVGSLHEFDERLVHRDEAAKMAAYQEFQSLRVADFPPGFLDEMQDADFDDLLINRAPFAGYSVEDYEVRSSAPTRVIDEGDVVDLGDRHFEVMHLPGHSPGSIGLYERASETLFSGDAIYDGLLLDGLPESNVTDYVATMKRLRTLPVRVVHGGHEPSFGRERLVELVDEYLALRT